MLEGHQNCGDSFTIEVTYIIIYGKNKVKSLCESDIVFQRVVKGVFSVKRWS